MPVYSKAIGSGTLLANDLINRYCHRATYDLNQLGTLSTYILSKVKQGVEGCGGPTDIVGLRSGRDVGFTEKKDIDELEQELTRMEELADQTFAKNLTAKPLTLSWLSEHRKKKSLKRLDAEKSGPAS
jgi:hypothetical protein